MTQKIALPHERLLAYQVALELLRQVQELSIADVRMRDQILRAARSVCLNIAEGVGRVGAGDKKRVYGIARGECCEAAAALDVAIAGNECDAIESRAARDTAGRLYALLTGLMRRYDSETFRPKTSHPTVDRNTNETEIGDDNEPEFGSEQEHETG